MLLALGVAALTVLQQEPPSPAHPNIVFILADDLGWKDVGFQGSAYPTPHLDRLASEGLVFTRAYAAAPSCSPTRAAILTGKHPARLGLTHAIRNKDYLDAREPVQEKVEPRGRFLVPGSLTHLPEGERTIATRLSAAGWDTGYVGKWHLGEPPYVPQSFGFEHAAAVGYYSSSPYTPPYRLRQLSPGKPASYLTDCLTEEALRFLRQPRERPFFLFLAHFAVHGPWQGKPELVQRFERTLDPASAQGNAEYAAMIASLDESVGAVLSALEELGLEEETLVVFTSDNGPTLAKERPITSVAPLRGGKLELYEGGIRVPLVLRWKGRIAPGSRCDLPVTSMDFYPTLLALCGLEREMNEAPDGRDLAALVTGGKPPERQPLFFHVPNATRPRAAILSGDLKLLHFFEGEDELYDLSTDPGEQHDLAPRDPERAALLRAELLAWLTSLGTPLPVPNPAHDPAAHQKEEEED